MALVPITAGSLQTAAEIILAGGLVAFPTETVYGLGGDAFNSAALARIFEAKGRPRFDPLIIHIADLEGLDRIARLEALDGEARNKLETICKNLWPGPLTVILPKRPEVPDLATSGLPTAAVRLPSHPAARELIRLSAGAVAAPSANPFGRLSPTRAEHVLAGLGDKVDIILDGGRCGVGLESTVLDLSGGGAMPRILRPGGVSREQIEALIGPVAVQGAMTGATTERPLSPGQLLSHYAPGTALYLHSPAEMILLKPEKDEGYLFFDDSSRNRWADGAASGTALTNSVNIRSLSAVGNTIEAAANLFETLHDMDRMGLRLIHAEKAPDEGLGPAINDRLGRAAIRRSE
ncbi:threonylcarbamoyl-AMP synthase [Spirochaetia bacterium]|nr:threonylcarbamoyl-AMP synthase [Spirochaetia bacterium]